MAVLVWSTAKAGGAMLFRDESRGKPEWVGVNASEHLSFARLGKASTGATELYPDHVQFCERHTSSSARSPGRNSLGLLSRVQPQLGAL